MNRLTLSDARLLYNHDQNRVPLARTPKTMQFTVSPAGLQMTATLPDTEEARAVYTAVQRGDLSGMSFAFKVPMAKHLKDKKITIYSKVDGGYSPGGFPLPGGWKPIHPGKLWAYARHLSAKEWWEAGVHSEMQQEERFFTVNWRDDVDADMMIRYRNTWYGIVRIDTFEDYKGDIKLYVKEAIGGQVPDDGEILPYE